MRAAVGFARLAVLALAVLPRAAASRPTIVAAENVYGDIARQVAGPDAAVTSVLSNPATDPHLYEPTASAARAVAAADLVIENGIGYDPWMARLVAVAGAPGRVLVVADLLGRHPGDNPHLWYDPQAAPALANRLAARLSAADPADAPAYAARLNRLLASLALLQARIDAVRQRFAGTKVTATEPVFGLMIRALGLRDTHKGFQLAVMNGAEPGAREIAALQDDLRARRVRALITNRQAGDPAAARLVAIAREAGVPVVPITETLPAGASYQSWVSDEVSALAAALALPDRPGGGGR